MDTQSDEVIVQKVLGGDTHLFGEIVNRYQNKLLRYVWYLTNHSNDSEDVVQETFIKVYRNLNGFNTTLKFSSWIYRIAHNEAMNFVKKKKPILVGHDEMYKLENIKNQTSNTKKIENTLYIRQLLDTLELKYREPLELYYIEERTYEEISDILRIPIGTVGIRIRRAKESLKHKANNS